MSIKNKLVTAITTAGLLAGLFGSAFVPSALARNSTTTPRAAATELVINNLDAIDGQGGFEHNVKATKINTFRMGSYANGHNKHSSGPKPDESSPIDLNDYSMGFLLKDSAGNAIELADLNATVTGSSVVVAWAYDGDDAAGVIKCDADLNANGAGVGYNLAAQYGTSDGVKNAPGLGTYWQSYGDGLSLDYLDLANTKVNHYDPDTADFDTDSGESDGLFWLCIKAKNSTKGISTIKVSANGVLVATVSVQVVGDMQSLEVSSTYPRIALDNGVIRNWVKLVAKDSAGQVLNAGYDGYYGNLEDIFNTTVNEKGTEESDLSTHADGSDIEWVRYGFLTGDDGSRADKVTIDADTCQSDSLDSDKGENLDLGVEAFNWGESLIQSNDLSITCTGESDEGVISSITAAVTTGEADWLASAAGVASYPYNYFKVTGVVKDQSGGLMGRDETTGYDPGAYSIDGDTAGLTTDLGIDDTMSSTVVGVDGKATIGTVVPDMDSLAKFRYTVVVTDANQGLALAQKLTTELFYTAQSGIAVDYTLTRVRNAAKTSATWTADFGVACSNQFVYFDWENIDGTKGNLAVGGDSLRRRANLEGVATFTLNKRKMVVFVTAYSCDTISAEVGPLKARFR
jgi:hypothetical protein